MCVLSQFLNVSHFIWLPSSERKILDRPEKRGARVINWKKKKKDEKTFFFSKFGGLYNTLYDLARWWRLTPDCLHSLSS
jgi:hypothetical protein